MLRQEERAVFVMPVASRDTVGGATEAAASMFAAYVVYEHHPRGALMVTSS